MPTLSGSCLCKTISFEIEGDIKGFFLCHCSRCRKVTGSAHASNLFTTDGTVRWLTGKDHISIYKHPNTRFTKSFCKGCGSALPTENRDAGHILVPAGSLDNDVPVRPNAHIFAGSKANWDVELHTIASYEALPTKN